MFESFNRSEKEAQELKLSKKEKKQLEEEQKEKEKLEKTLNKYNLSSLTNPDDIESVKTIVYELAGTGAIELGAAFGGAGEKTLLKVIMYYNRALLEQNFIQIRQNERIEKLLQELVEQGKNKKES